MRLFRFRGADIVCSPVLLLALPAAFVMGRGWQTAAAFASLTLHEAAHAAAARRAGCKVESIEAQPFGFVARLNCRYADPRDAAAVFAAGPIASLCLAAASALLCLYAPKLLPFSKSALLFLNSLSDKNLLIAGINLLPALPLDGGRLILSLIRASDITINKRGGADTAAHLLCAIGAIAGAALIAAFALLLVYKSFNPTFLLMGSFLVFSAIKEARSVYSPQRHRRLTSSDVIAVRQIAVGQHVSIASAMRMLPVGAFALITVLDASHNRIGALDETQLAQAASRLGASATMRAAVAYCGKKML